VIVELFGPSGSGKSYHVKRLAAEHNTKRIRVRFGQKYLLAAIFALLNPGFVRRVFAMWNAETRRTPTLRGNKLYRLISFMAKEQKARIRGGGIIDEGIIQYFLILYEDATPIAEVEECLALLRRPDYLVCIVESDVATRFRRMEERGKVSRWELGDAYVRHWQDVLQSNVTGLKPVLQSLFACEIVHNE
jgi:cytidylate kinase